MPIPPLSRRSVEQALDALSGRLDEITSGPHRSTTYDLVWKGLRFPPKVVVSKAVELQEGHPFPESRFSGGEDPGQANYELRQLGFDIQLKPGATPAPDAGVRRGQIPSFPSIVQEIERKARGHEIGRLQEIRKELKGQDRQAGHTIFGAQTIFEDWAFHYGGRSELQFNVGFEPFERLRHGLAFSFQASQTLPNPEEVLIPKVARFNEFFTMNPHQFPDMLMWQWIRGERIESDHSPAPITPELMQRDVFVFLGKMQPLRAIDYDMIVDDFDRLLALYRFVEGDADFPVTTVSQKAGFQFKPGCAVKPSRTTGSRAQQELNINLRHNDLQKALYRHLASLYGQGNVGAENEAASGQIDVVVRQGERFWFYEIKTSMSARGCIREGLAQLLEYSLWPGGREAKKLIVVGEPPLDDDSRRYIASLRDRFSMPIEYCQFDLSAGRIVGSSSVAKHRLSGTPAAESKAYSK